MQFLYLDSLQFSKEKYAAILCMVSFITAILLA